MKIKVLRDYSGAEGSGPDKDVAAGSIHTVTRARGAALVSNRLAEIVSDEAHPDDNKEDDMPDEKQIAPIANKAAPAPRNKEAPKAPDKGVGSQGNPE